MITHIAEALYDDRLAFHPGLQFQPLHDIRHMTNLPDAIKYTEARRFPAAPHTSLRYRLARYTGQRIDLPGTHAHIGVQDPGHLAFTRSIIRSRHIRTGTDKILLDQFGSITSGDLFQFIRSVFLGIDADPA